MRIRMRDLRIKYRFQLPSVLHSILVAHLWIIPHGRSRGLRFGLASGFCRLLFVAPLLRAALAFLKIIPRTVVITVYT